MANETDTGLPTADIAGAALAELAARPFDPATLLTAPPAPGLPYAAGPSAEVVHTFDPATLLGDAARRGPAMIGDGKPLVARIGGVEVVTIPVEHYAALMSPLAFVARQDAALNSAGMFDLLLSLHESGRVSDADLSEATGLDLVDLASRIAAWNASRPKPWLVDSMDADGTMRGKTHEDVPFSIGPALDPAASPVDLTPSPEESTIDLVPEPVEVPLTVEQVAQSYDAAAQHGERGGGAMDRQGNPAEPTGKGVAAHHAERGSSKRSRR